MYPLQNDPKIPPNVSKFLTHSFDDNNDSYFTNGIVTTNTGEQITPRDSIMYWTNPIDDSSESISSVWNTPPLQKSDVMPDFYNIAVNLLEISKDNAERQFCGDSNNETVHTSSGSSVSDGSSIAATDTEGGMIYYGSKYACESLCNQESHATQKFDCTKSVAPENLKSKHSKRNLNEQWATWPSNNERQTSSTNSKAPENGVQFRKWEEHRASSNNTQPSSSVSNCDAKYSNVQYGANNGHRAQSGGYTTKGAVMEGINNHSSHAPNNKPNNNKAVINMPHLKHYDPAIIESFIIKQSNSTRPPNETVLYQQPLASSIGMAQNNAALEKLCHQQEQAALINVQFAEQPPLPIPYTPGWGQQPQLQPTDVANSQLNPTGKTLINAQPMLRRLIGPNVCNSSSLSHNSNVGRYYFKTCYIFLAHPLDFSKPIA